jgi:hypothetical protein
LPSFWFDFYPKYVAPTVMSFNHAGVTTIKRLDQGHLCPLGERQDKHVTVGARTSALLRSRRPLNLKCNLDSLFAGYSEPLFSLGARGKRSSTVPYFIWCKKSLSVETGTIFKYRYTRNRMRYISNAGGMCGIFFFLSFHTAIYKPTIFLEPVLSPPSKWIMVQRRRH